MPKSPSVPLIAAYQDKLTFQSYPPPPAIDGVWLHKLRKHRSTNGALMEFLRLGPDGSEGLPTPFTPRQISVSWAAPGRVNAFHIHVKRPQAELWTVAQGQLLVWLADMRAESTTRDVRRGLVLSAEEPALLHIPTGVAHGYRAGPDGALVLYAMDSQFDAADPNEGRIPWDVFGPGIWEDDRG